MPPVGVHFDDHMHLPFHLLEKSLTAVTNSFSNTFPAARRRKLMRPLPFIRIQTSIQFI